jgi:anti-sigma factor RsiW
MYKILFIEDGELLAQRVVCTLRAAGFSVDVVGSDHAGVMRVMAGDYGAVDLDRAPPDLDIDGRNLPDANTMAPTDPRNHTPLSEADIHAYADGLLASDRACYLQQYLGSHPGEARRVAFYGRLNAKIKRAFRHVDELSPPRTSLPWVSNTPWRTMLRRKFVQLGNIAALRTALTLVVALVAVSGWIAATQVSAQTLNNAAVIALAQTSDIRVDAVDPSLATRGGEPAPDLMSLGLRLVAKKLVQLGPCSRAAEFVYQNADGKRVVLLSASSLTARAEPNWTAHRVGNIRLLTWTTHRERYVLAGEADTHGLMRAADTLTVR